MSWAAIAGPGLLVAATGVGAGDLATASLAGMAGGVAILWAVWAGAFLKFVITEGIARWQLATGETLLAGCSAHFGRPFQFAFLLYLLPWSYFVGGALIGACGVAAHALLPVFSEAALDKQFYGPLHSLAAAGLVLMGGYRLFEWTMRVMIGLMFATVLFCAVALQPDWGAIAAGLVIPRIPDAGGEGLSWTVALMGGVGGTLTVLCYGYWIREEGREGPAYIRTCRIDLAVGYAMTALFGIAMVIIGSRVATEGSGAALLSNLGAEIGESVGPAARWLFLLGAWGAVFSSLLGVLQSVPLIFADFMSDVTKESADARKRRIATTSRTYRAYLAALALLPCLTLFADFRDVQKYYAVIGAGFMPFLAFVLLYLNGARSRVGVHANRPGAIAALVLCVLFFAWVGWKEIQDALAGT